MTCRKKQRTCRGTLKLRRGRTVVAKRALRVRRTKTVRFTLATASVAGRAPARLKASLRGARVTVR